MSKFDHQILTKVSSFNRALPRQERRKSSRVLQIQAQERKGIYSENKQKRLDEAKQQRTLATGNRKREKELLDERKATFDLWGELLNNHIM